MNFRHMPELDWTLGYPLAILIMVVAVLLLRWNFRRGLVGTAVKHRTPQRAVRRDLWPWSSLEQRGILKGGGLPCPTKGATMDFSAQFDDLQKRVVEAKVGGTDCRHRVARPAQAAHRPSPGRPRPGCRGAKQQGSQAADEARGKWAQMKADAAARRDDVKAKIDQRSRELDAKTAASEAGWAEADAVDALDYAAWTVSNAAAGRARRDRRPRLRRRAGQAGGEPMRSGDELVEGDRRRFLRA